MPSPKKHRRPGEPWYLCLLVPLIFAALLGTVVLINHLWGTPKMSEPVKRPVSEMFGGPGDPTLLF
jgi:hypothetical protein